MYFDDRLCLVVDTAVEGFQRMRHVDLGDGLAS
jgi:hypothetical protein